MPYMLPEITTAAVLVSRFSITSDCTEHELGLQHLNSQSVLCAGVTSAHLQGWLTSGGSWWALRWLPAPLG